MADEPEDPDRAAILRRRNRWIALALSSAAAGTLASCGPCLSILREDGGVDAATDAGGEDGDDAGVPQPCLSPLPPDAGEATDAGEPDDEDAGGPDAGTPTPCLSPMP